MCSSGVVKQNKLYFFALLQVCSILWSKEHKELISGHGYTKNQLSLWKYPHMKKITDLTGMFRVSVRWMLGTLCFQNICGSIWLCFQNICGRLCFQNICGRLCFQNIGGRLCFQNMWKTLLPEHVEDFASRTYVEDFASRTYVEDFASRT